MCTTILIGKKASYDGSTLVVRIEDSSAGMFKSSLIGRASCRERV